MFIPGVTTRPALEIVDFFKGFARADVVKLPLIKSGVIDSAKILNTFVGNIFAHLPKSLFPLFRGDVLKRMLALLMAHKDFCECGLSSPE